MGETHYAFYRMVVVDQRKKRDGRVIEEVGIYNPNTNPSTIELNSERIQYWLSVGAQPSDAVLVMLKLSGDWQKFKKLPAENTLKTYTKDFDAEKAVKEASDQAQKIKAKKSADAAKAKAEAEKANQLLSKFPTNTGFLKTKGEQLDSTLKAASQELNNIYKQADAKNKIDLKGDYISVIDADDVIEPSTLRLVSEAPREDIIIGNFYQ